jgi:hypothetical protein
MSTPASSSAPVHRGVPPRRRVAAAIVLAVAVMATSLVASGDLGPSPVEAQTGQCVTATNSAHVQAGRARSFFIFTFANGSNDYLGLTFATTSLQQTGANAWTLVDQCGPGGSSTSSSTSTPGGGGRPPLTQQYQAMYETDAGIPGHTVYRPRDLAAVTHPMPIVVWGNGACSGNGTWFQEFLTPLSAHGVLVIASGTPNGSGSTNAQDLVEGIDWAIRENSRQGSKYFGKIDTDAVSAMGQSCGGLQAVSISDDPRVDSTVLWNSGIFSSGGLGEASKSDLNRLHGPTAWLNGGPSDIAYSNAVDDYQRVPATVPAVLGAYGNVGHTGMFTDPAIEREIVGVAADWLDATLYDNAQARAQFVGPNCGLCQGTEWDMQSKNW